MNIRQKIAESLKHDESVHRLLVTDKLTIAYMLFTSIIITLQYHQIQNYNILLTHRLIVTTIIILLYCLRKFYPCKMTRLFSSGIVMLGLIFWYTEIYYFASLLPYKDHWFAMADWNLFGCQPSIKFSQKVTSAFWSEVFNFGYYSYYYLMLIVLAFYAFMRYEQLNEVEFIFLSSFFMFYIIYMFLPVAGPYYYFKAIGIDVADRGVYEDLGCYFRENHEMLQQDVKGIFSQLVLNTQKFGELPAAAFPSSHCGMTILILIMAWKSNNRILFWCIVPFMLLICCATVYIRAHYLVDTIAGVVFAVFFYFLNLRIFKSITSIGSHAL